MNRRSMILTAAILALLLWLGGAAALAEYTTLKQGDKGAAVLALKQRMYELGYFTSTKFSAEFNATTKERLVELQKKNGLKADGIATPEVQAFIFSDACLPKSAPSPTATPKPAAKATDKPAEKSKKQTAAPGGLTAPEGAPQTDEEGFLPAGKKVYSLSDRKNGVWSYISQDLHIEIRQYSGKSPWGANIWLEISIRMKAPARLRSLLSAGKKPGTNLVLPSKIIQDSGVTPILAINDDFFGYRVRYGGKIGVIIRGGKILYNDPRAADSKVFPPLDILARFSDGTLKTFTSDEHTAQEYLNMGVTDTFAFGPILVRDGKVQKDAANFGTKRAPRLAIGVTADGTIKVLDVLGRRTDAKGVNVAWVADKMKEMGCVQALNLDGGNTTCVIFMGDMINRPEKTAAKDIRRVTGLIGIVEGTK